MRNLIGSCLILVLLLSACSLPALNPTPTTDLVGTQVSINLTKAPGSTQAVVTTSSLPTVLSSSAPSQTASPAPSVTVEGTATTTATVTATVTGTVSASATLTPIMSPTNTPSSDPRSTLGDPTWKDTFQNANSWGLASPYDDGNTRVEITGGAMVLTSANAKGWHGWRVSYLKPKNFYLEATLTTQTCASSDQYGLLFRSPDNSSGYWFEITCDGHYALTSGDGGTFTDILKIKASNAIHAGPNQTNRFGVMVKDNSITLYANGKKLDSATDTTYPNNGTFGLFIAGYKTINFTYSCTEIDYWKVQ